MQFDHLLKDFHQLNEVMKTYKVDTSKRQRITEAPSSPHAD